MPNFHRIYWFRRSILAALAAVVLLAGALPAFGQTYLDLENQVREFKLDNGMTFLVIERHDVPVFSFCTYVGAGSANEVRGITGIAHILEHMAFKGTAEIGTKDYPKEQKAMAAEDAAFAALKTERLKRENADPEKLAQLEAAFTSAKEAARELVVSNQFGEIVEQNGGVGLNASTGADLTQYYYSFPSNRLDLWAYLEGSRMSAPVMREFYTEKDGAVTEERRMRTDNNPFGRLMEQFQNLAFMANGYHHSTIGYMSDLNNISRQDCEDFYGRNYVGKNICVAVVGDVDAAQVEKLARKYFGKISAGDPRPVETREPDQLAEKRMTIMEESQPILMLGWKIEGQMDADWPVYQAIADILGQGRTSRLYTKLVKEDKQAVQTFSFAGFPGSRYTNLMTVFGIPVKGVGATQLETSIRAEVARLVEGGVTAEELAGVKQRARANFLRGLDTNGDLAGQLASYQMDTGDWRNLFREVKRLEAVTADDVKRVAAEIFQDQRLTVAMIENEQS
jgi:predicted Zn-dependent peptidase